MNVFKGGGIFSLTQAFSFKLMETSGTDMLNDSDNRAPISPLHLAVSISFFSDDSSSN